MPGIRKLIHGPLLAVTVNWLAIGAAGAQSRWTRAADLNTPHEYHACAVAEGRLYAVGGNRRAAFEVFDPKSNAWHLLPPLRTERSFPGVAPVGRKIYAVGGIGDEQGTLSTVECFTLDAGKWTNGCAHTSRSVSRCPHFEKSDPPPALPPSAPGTAQFVARPQAPGTAPPPMAKARVASGQSVSRRVA